MRVAVRARDGANRDTPRMVNGDKRAQFYFYDLETSGRDPRWHRILQFAGVSCDAALEPIEDPLVLRGRLPADVLPEVEAMLVTQLTPGVVAEGLGEGALAVAIQAATGDSRLCLAGYNSIRFDDEFLRFGCYRNLLPAYGRERSGGTRFDVLELVRAVRALRPEGVVWPTGEDGLPSARLTDLTAANGIAHFAAHDAASDVLATVALARLLRNAQPRLFDFAVSLRERRACERLLSPGDEPVVHVSGMIPRERQCLALVTPLGTHPRNARGYVVFDLDVDPRELMTLPVEELRRRVFGPAEQVGTARLRIKEIRSNRTPFVAPFATLRPSDATRLGVDRDEALARHRYLRRTPELARRLLDAYCRSEPFPASVDADAALYDGFIDDADERLMAMARLRVDDGLPDDEAQLPRDPRLRVLLRRYRVRNAPVQQLGEAERAEWRSEVQRRWRGELAGPVSLAQFAAALTSARSAGRDEPLLAAWEAHARARATEFGLAWPDKDATAPVSATPAN